MTQGSRTSLIILTKQKYKKNMNIKYFHLKTDFSIFLGIITLLICTGCIFIYSSSSIYALERFGYGHYYLKNQIVGIILGLLIFYIARIIPNKLIFSCTPLLFFGSLFLTFLSLLPYFGMTIHGASRWLKVGSFAFQPSELLKISSVLYIAYFLSKKMHASFSFVKIYLPFLCITGITALILLKQPDFGLAVTLVITALMMLFIAGLPLSHVALCIGSLIPALAALILMQPYRLKRIIAFIDPWKDAKGAGFQIIQSLIAIGSGNWFGVGISHSKQKFFYLPMQHTDFIFSIIAEEIGLLGSSGLLLLFFLFTYFGIKIAWQLEEPFAIIATLGFTLLISIQTYINLFVVAGLLPTKGIGLPFISYGNSSLICFIAMIGIIANFIDHQK